MEQTNRIHRVGAITAGISLMVMGMLFILEKLIPALDYHTILQFWPFILIGLGVEILLSNKKSKQFIYDGVAVFIMIMMVALAWMMACAEIVLNILSKYPMDKIIN